MQIIEAVRINVDLDPFLSMNGLAALKAGTRDSYVNTARLHVLKTFGLRAINSISRSEIEDWWVTLRRGKLTKSRLIQIRAVLAGIFRRATISGVIAQNPAEAIQGRMGREDRAVHQAEWLTEEEVSRLLAMAKQREPRYHPILLTLVSTGIRLGECLGLQVRDMDLDRGWLAIRRSLRKYQESSPKSGKPRTVFLPEATREVAAAWEAILGSISRNPDATPARIPA